MATTFRVFISSPSDVFAERERVERVIVRLNGEFGGGLLQAIRWERAYYTAAKTFQDQIPLPSETDLVICVLWKRLGFELPPEYRRPDGTTPTGTEYEFENAMESARSKGTPDVLVYRKSAPVLLNAEQIEMERAQFEALKTFWSQWFRTEAGHFVAAYQSFDNTDAFETLVEDHIRQWLARHRVTTAGVTWPIEQRGSPFRGLQPFDAAHTTVFFGRRRVIERARERLTDAAQRGMAFLLILGTSGSGKSSLARAGLVPRLMQPGAVPGVDLWRCCTMRPGEGDTPLHALARALYAADALPELAAGDCPTPPDFAALLAGAPESAARALRLALGRATVAIAAREAFDRPVEARLLLMVDQFEEALAAPEPRDAFARALTLLIGTGLVWVVATLRSDLYAPFQACPALTALRDGGTQLDLLPPSSAELAEIVTGPAAAAGLRFDPRADGTGLDEVLTTAADQPGALPLLQLALDALFEARDPAASLLTISAYDAFGGLPGVVEQRAEATLAVLDPEAAAALPAVLRGVVDVTEDGIVTGRAGPLEQVAASPGARRLVDAFVAARLLVAQTQYGATRIRVAHDALLSSWPRASAAISADREALRTRGRVEAAAHRWRQEGRDPDFLLPSGRPLAEAAELASRRPESLGDDAHAFVRQSQDADAARHAAAEAHAQRELRREADAQQARADAATRVVRRTRVAVAAVSVLLVTAAGAAVFAHQQRNEAVHQAERAEQQTAVAERQTTLAEAQTVKAERNFQAALDAGASLVGAVNAHLTDGGMTRRVARDLLDTASAGIGALLPRDAVASLRPALLDTQSRLEVSFSRVLGAVCGGGEARVRAEQALATAEAVAQQAPSEERERAVIVALQALAFAAEGENDWAGAQALFERAETLAVAHTGPGWKDLLQEVRRDLAFTISDGPQRRRAVALLQDDLAWGQEQATLRPDDLLVVAHQAKSERFLAYSAAVAREQGAALDGMLREAALLQRLARAEPNNLEWQRWLANNARQRSAMLYRQGDAAGSLALLQEAAAGNTAVLARDPENARYLIIKLSTDIALARALLAHDTAGAVAVLRPGLEAVEALGGAGAGTRMCKTEAAQLAASIGTVLILLGSSEEGIAALEASTVSARALAASAPGDTKLQRAVVDAELSVARGMVIARKDAGVAAHARAGIATLLPLLGAGPPEWHADLSRLRQFLGNSLVAIGDTADALAAFEDDRKAGEALLAAHPDDERARHQMAVSLLRTAAVQGLAENNGAQRQALNAAAAALAPLANRADLPIDWQRTIIDLHQNVCTALMVAHQYPAGIARCEEALRLAEALDARFPAEEAARRTHTDTLTLTAAAFRMSGQEDRASALDAQSKTLRGG